MPSKSSTEKKKGRPRDDRAHQCVLEAVRDHLRKEGLCGLTMEGIARQAGVGKQTLYRWWPSLAEVTLEALAAEAGETCFPPHTGDPAEDLGVFLRQTFSVIRQNTGPLLCCLMVEAQKDEAFQEKFRSVFIRQRQEVLAGLLERAWRPGGLDPWLAVDIVFGTLWYRLLVGHAPLDDALADTLAQVAISLVSRSLP